MSASALSNFRDLWSESDKWQSLTGTDNAAAAEAFIQIHGRDGDPEDGELPVLLIYPAAYSLSRVAVNAFQDSGQIGFRLMLATPAGDDIDARIAAIESSLQALADDLLGLETTMILDEVTFDPPVFRAKTNKYADRIEVRGSASWGLGA